ncbi:MAG: hypothetical protein ACI87O_002349 [Planctomycetota bacterium]|jgi:hypothetical protein
MKTDMLKKTVAWLLLAGLGIFAVGQIRASLRSPTERLLWQVQSMVEDFNQGHIRQLMVGFGEDFRDESSGALKSEVHSALAGLVLSQRDPEANCFALEAAWVAPFVPEISEDETSATAEVHMRITHTSRGNSRSWWEAKAKLEFAYVAGKWDLHRTRSVNHRDRK